MGWLQCPERECMAHVPSPSSLNPIIKEQVVLSMLQESRIHKPKTSNNSFLEKQVRNWRDLDYTLGWNWTKWGAWVRNLTLNPLGVFTGVGVRKPSCCRRFGSCGILLRWVPNLCSVSTVHRPGGFSLSSMNWDGHPPSLIAGWPVRNCSLFLTLTFQVLSRLAGLVAAEPNS